MLIKKEKFLLGSSRAKTAIRRIKLAESKIALLDALIQSLIEERNPYLAEDIEGLIDSVASEIAEQIKMADFPGVLFEELRNAKARERKTEEKFEECSPPVFNEDEFDNDAATLLERDN